jgi:hypothetical protein
MAAGCCAQRRGRVNHLAAFSRAREGRAEMPDREHAPVPYRRCRFDGGCCRADPVARARPPPHHRRPRYRVHHSPRTELAKTNLRKRKMVVRRVALRCNQSAATNRHRTSEKGGRQASYLIRRARVARRGIGGSLCWRARGALSPRARHKWSK